jgi:hypothetical protein
MMKTALAPFGGAAKEESMANIQLIPDHAGHRLLPPTYDRPKYILCLVFAFVGWTHETCRPGCLLQETIVRGP